MYVKQSEQSDLVMVLPAPGRIGTKWEFLDFIVVSNSF